MAKYPRIEQVFVQDLEEGDQLISITPPGSSLPTPFKSAQGGGENLVVFNYVVSSSTNLVSSEFLTTLVLRSQESNQTSGGTPSTLTFPALSIATIADGDLNKLVP